MKKRCYITMVCLFMVLTWAAGASAHMMWLLPDDDTPAPGQAVNITLGFGHQFGNEVMERDGMAGAGPGRHTRRPGHGG